MTLWLVTIPAGSECINNPHCIFNRCLFFQPSFGCENVVARCCSAGSGRTCASVRAAIAGVDYKSLPAAPQQGQRAFPRVAPLLAGAFWAPSPIPLPLALGLGLSHSQGLRATHIVESRPKARLSFSVIARESPIPSAHSRGKVTTPFADSTAGVGSGCGNLWGLRVGRGLSCNKSATAT